MNWNEQRISRQLKLRDLHVLMTVARSGSMGKAANQLSVSQPAISKAIADMETALGVRLLDRNLAALCRRSMRARCWTAASSPSTN
jgi:molybdenum-dependent DNA-binding transcriptional regulator ModE